MLEHDELVDRIEATRITYPLTEHGVRIEGSPFSVEFPGRVDPERFCDEVRTAEEPWRLFGIKSELAEDYWKLLLVLYHVDDSGEVVGASKLSLEVAPEWARIYVKDECSAERAARFVETLHDEYDVDVTFPRVEG